MKKFVTAALTGVLLLGLASGCSQSAGTGTAVSVEPVSMIVNAGATGLADRYAGKVVAGQSADVKRDSSKTVQTIFVEEGDIVQEGDPLFCYDMDKMQLDLEKLQLDKENYENTIASAENAIAELEAERDKAKDSEKLGYTLQIDSKKAEIREAQYNISLKERDIASMETSMESAEVYSPISGRVMTVDETGSSYSDPYSYYDSSQSGDTSVGFITVTDVARLRVQGNINEMNAYALSEGMPLRIRSRLDSSKTWMGTLSMIDWENPVTGSNNNGTVVISDSSSDEMTSSSKYPFYVELEDTEGLMMGQHVYIETNLDDGADAAPAGPMLPTYYIAYGEDDSPFVWAASDKDKLEKRPVTLGEADEMNGTTEITEGLALSDYIAFPEEGLEEGQPVERYDPSAASQEDPAMAEMGF